jgi:Family of unknown function (DUF6518)
MTQQPIALAAVVGLAVGALTSIGQTDLDGPPAAFVNSASAWLVAPFAVGATMRTPRGAAVAGLLVCLFQLEGYYTTAQARGFPTSHSLIVFWTACAVVAGRSSVPRGTCGAQVRFEALASHSHRASGRPSQRPVGPKRSVLIARGSCPSRTSASATASTNGVGPQA